MTGQTNAGGGGGLSTSNALLHVNAPLGSTVELAKGGVTVKTIPPSGAFPNVDGTTADYYYSITPSNFGSWAVTSGTFSAAVTVDAAKQYDITQPTELWIVKDGAVNPLYTATNAGGSYFAGDGYILLHSNAVSGSYATLYFAPNIDVTYYNTLVLDAAVRGYYSAGDQTPAVGLISEVRSGSSSSTFLTYRLLLSAGTGTLQARTTYDLDISLWTGDQMIGYQEAGSAYSSWQGDIYCYNLYLTR